MMPAPRASIPFDTVSGMRKVLSVIESCCVPVASSLSDDEAAELERLLRALADRHRVKIVSMLAQAVPGAICVCDFVPSLGLAQPTVSYHLKQLVEAGLLARERRGTFAYYTLVPGALARVREVFAEPAGLAAAG